MLLEQQRDAQAMANRGLVAVALVPISIVAGLMTSMWLDSFLPIVIAALYATLGGCLGVLWLIAGFVRIRGAKRELRELDDRRLPKARLLR